MPLTSTGFNALGRPLLFLKSIFKVCLKNCYKIILLSPSHSRLLFHSLCYLSLALFYDISLFVIRSCCIVPPPIQRPEFFLIPAPSNHPSVPLPDSAYCVALTFMHFHLRFPWGMYKISFLSSNLTSFSIVWKSYSFRCFNYVLNCVPY